MARWGTSALQACPKGRTELHCVNLSEVVTINFCTELRPPNRADGAARTIGRNRTAAAAGFR
jgi:hypothetical protein